MKYPDTPPIITVFGGGGFIGRYVSEALLKTRARLRVAERDPRRDYFLQPLADVGQLSAMVADLGRPETIMRTVEGAEAVINLVGIFNGNLERIHVHGAGTLAAAAWVAGAKSFVHVSAIGADPNSPAEYGRTKGLGEQAVRAGYPGATIIRPSVVFGPEDNFTNRFAALIGMPVVPVIAPRARFQPIFVLDLARAIAAAAIDRATHAGITYELAGPEAMTMRELNSRIAEMAGRSPKLIDVPDVVAAAMAILGFLPGAPLTRDQWLMLMRDNVPSCDLPGLEAFGITPTPLAAVAPEWLGHFRKGGRFAPRAA